MCRGCYEVSYPNPGLSPDDALTRPGCARVAGVPTLSLVELFVQNAYFAFQVVQVFIVTTLTSAASGAITDVLQDPLSAKDLLADNLPKSSNFYIAYILIQSLAVGASGLVHLVDIFRHYVIAKRMGSPRAMFNVWHRVRVVHWGGIFPVFTNMGVIGGWTLSAVFELTLTGN